MKPITIPGWGVWIITPILALSLGAAALWARKIDTTTQENREAITRIEAQRHADKERLDRIEEKIDFLIDKLWGEGNDQARAEAKEKPRDHQGGFLGEARRIRQCTRGRPRDQIRPTDALQVA